MQFRMVSKTEILGPPLEDELGKMRRGLWREVGFAKNEDSGPERRIFAWTIGPKRCRFAVLCRIVTGDAETPYACDSPAMLVTTATKVVFGQMAPLCATSVLCVGMQLAKCMALAAMILSCC